MSEISNLSTIGFIVGAVVLGLLVIGGIFARLYVRATKERAFVRTGMGGQKVVMNGGALVLPVLHETIAVNMNTLRLGVERKNEQALITKDRLRVDVLAEFYLRVKPDLEAIAIAAQTLGDRTLDPTSLKAMIEGKFVDALRSVAAELNMTDLHEKRSEFVQRVQVAVTEDLYKKGLELESVSLTGLDQTDKKYFNPDNVFDAQGLAIITEQTQARLKQINDVEQETAVLIAKKNREARQQQLEIERDVKYAELEQTRELETREAEQRSAIAREQAEQDQTAREAEIQANRNVDQRRIGAEKEIETAEIEKRRLVEEQGIRKQQAIEIAEQNRKIAVAEKSKEQSEADRQANEALALAVKAEEEVLTVKRVEEAERLKRIEVIDAEKEAERQATGIKVAAAAEKAAAEDEAESVRLRAKADADATMIRAQADEERQRVDADGVRMMNEALNSLSQVQVDLKQVLSLHDALPRIIAESVKPLENIESIKIAAIDGLNGTPVSVSDGSVSRAETGLADQIVNASLKHQAMKPLMDNLMDAAGMSSLSDMAKSVATGLNKVESKGEETTAEVQGTQSLTAEEQIDA